MESKRNSMLMSKRILALFLGISLVLSSGGFNVINAVNPTTDIIYVSPNGNDNNNGLSPTNDGVNGPKKTIENALETVQTGGTIHIENGTITNEDELTVDKNVVIEGEGHENTIIDGKSKGNIHIEKWEHITVNIKDITIQNQKDNLGGIYNPGTLTINNCTLQNNKGNCGGAILNDEGNVTIINSTLQNNRASQIEFGIYSTGGGAIYTNGGRVSITGCNIVNNTASTNCGGVDNAEGNVIITDSTLSGNHGVFDGGAIYNGGGTLIVTRSNITGNKACQGAGIYNLRGTVHANYNRITGNTAGIGSQYYGIVGHNDITNNWWGSNKAPTVKMIYGKGLLCVHYKPWLSRDEI